MEAAAAGLLAWANASIKGRQSSKGNEQTSWENSKLLHKAVTDIADVVIATR